MNKFKKINFFSHLQELRICIINYLKFFLFIALIVVFFSEKVTIFIIKIVEKNIIKNCKLITNSPQEITILQLKIVLYLSFAFSVPFLFFFLWKFISPGLYKKEKKFIFKLFLFSFILLFAGINFSYFIIIPTLFFFFINNIPKQIEAYFSVTLTLELFINTIFIFSIIFLIPVLMVFLNKLELINYETIIKKRKILIVTSFILGAIFTPSDVFSQFLLAIPIILLIELSVFLIKNKKYLNF